VTSRTYLSTNDQWARSVCWVISLKLHRVISVQFSYVNLYTRFNVVGCQIFWLRNGDRLDVAADTNFIISNDGNLIISQARLSDAGNYSCGAQNIAGRRLSDPARLSVFGSTDLQLLIQSGP